MSTHTTVEDFLKMKDIVVTDISNHYVEHLVRLLKTRKHAAKTHLLSPVGTLEYQVAKREYNQATKHITKLLKLD